jgi:hypothetical protein
MLMIRPSARVAVMASSFTRTAVIRKSRFAAVIMPLSPYQIAIYDDFFVDDVQFPT